MILTNIVKNLSGRFNTSLSLDENGICTFTVNGKYLISLENSTDNKGFFLYSVLYALSHDHEKEEAIELLTANLFGHATGKGSIGYDPSTRSLIYFEFFDNEATEPALFYEELSLYVMCLDALIKKHQQPLETPLSESAQSMNEMILKNASSKGKMIFLG